MKIIKYIILGILICFTIEVVGQIKMDFGSQTKTIYKYETVVELTTVCTGSLDQCDAGYRLYGYDELDNSNGCGQFIFLGNSKEEASRSLEIILNYNSIESVRFYDCKQKAHIMSCYSANTNCKIISQSGCKAIIIKNWQIREMINIIKNN